VKPLQGTTNQKERPERRKKALFSPRKGRRLNSSALETLICLLKKRSPEGVKTFELGTRVIPQKINLRPDIGPARHGDMKVEEVLKLLEKHEKECNERYKKIDRQLERFDVRLWGIALLILATSIAGEFI
jgi:hypothetical protein